jgi:hypothetical protein
MKCGVLGVHEQWQVVADLVLGPAHELMSGLIAEHFARFFSTVHPFGLMI